MTYYFYDRQGKVIPDGFDGWATRSVPEYYELQETIIAGCVVLTRWVGMDMNMPLALMLSGEPNPCPTIFETIIFPPYPTFIDTMYGIYTDRFCRESQAQESHTRALLWLKGQLELRA